MMLVGKDCDCECENQERGAEGSEGSILLQKIPKAGVECIGMM